MDFKLLYLSIRSTCYRIIFTFTARSYPLVTPYSLSVIVKIDSNFQICISILSSSTSIARSASEQEIFHRSKVENLLLMQKRYYINPQAPYRSLAHRPSNSEPPLVCEERENSPRITIKYILFLNAKKYLHERTKHIS